MASLDYRRRQVVFALLRLTRRQSSREHSEGRHPDAGWDMPPADNTSAEIRVIYSLAHLSTETRHQGTVLIRPGGLRLVPFGKRLPGVP